MRAYYVLRGGHILRGRNGAVLVWFCGDAAYHTAASVDGYAVFKENGRFVRTLGLWCECNKCTNRHTGDDEGWDL